MRIIKHFLIAAVAAVGFHGFIASAAVLSLVPQGQNFNVGQEFLADLVLDAEGVNVNAAQAVISFPQDSLQFISADRSNSMFNFWVEDPSASNGSISFIGGTDKSVAGDSLLIFKAKFKIIGAGTATLRISEGVVTASDGTGTNVLSATKGATIAVSPSEIAPAPPPPAQEQPQKIVREPAPAQKLPAVPKIRINLYPDEAKWYNYTGEVIALWEVPEDVIQVAKMIDQNPNTIPKEFDKELFNGKNLGSLKDGIWYVHVRFRNSVGLGPTTHSRLAIDTVPPVAFSLTFAEGASTDNPQPTINFQTNDALSGLDYYEIKIGNEKPVKITVDQLSYTLPLLAPGKRAVKARAIDKAGNFSESGVEIEILPIASPVITEISKDVFVGEGNFLARGTAQPDFIIRIAVKKKSGEVVGDGLATVDKSGNWETVIDQPLKRGLHFVEVIAQDSRGALSLPVKSDLFKIRERPMFIVAGVGITQLWFFAGLIFLLLGGFAIGGLSYRIWRAQLRRKAIVAQRDVVTMSNLIQKDIEKALASYADKRLDEREASEIEFLLKNVKENLKKTQKYVIGNIEEISE